VALPVEQIDAEAVGTKGAFKMKRWILAAMVGVFSFSALAADPPANDKAAAKPAKATKKRADATKKDDSAKKPEAK
jgi:hypothetical protein